VRNKKKDAKMAGGEEHMVLRNYAMPKVTKANSSNVRPVVEAHNFEVKPSLIKFMKGGSFGGHPSEDPNMHLHDVLAKCDTIKLNGVSTDAIRLRLFPFSLKDKTNDWLQNEAPNSFSTWEILSKAFLSKYFPSGKTAKLRVDITFFAQRDGESLYEAWERLKDLQ